MEADISTSELENIYFSMENSPFWEEIEELELCTSDANRIASLSKNAKMPSLRWLKLKTTDIILGFTNLPCFLNLQKLDIVLISSSKVLKKRI